MLVKIQTTNMKKVSVVLIGILMVASIQSTWAQKEKFHSIFIYNFSKYVKWPDAQNSGIFVIGVLGTSAIQKDLKKMAAAKKDMLKISQLAQRAGVSIPTVKHYVREGLLPRPMKTSRNMAYYSQDDVGRRATT